MQELKIQRLRDNIRNKELMYSMNNPEAIHNHQKGGFLGGGAQQRKGVGGGLGGMLGDVLGG